MIFLNNKQDLSGQANDWLLCVKNIIFSKALDNCAFSNKLSSQELNLKFLKKNNPCLYNILNLQFQSKLDFPNYEEIKSFTEYIADYNQFYTYITYLHRAFDCLRSKKIKTFFVILIAIKDLKFEYPSKIKIDEIIHVNAISLLLQIRENCKMNYKDQVLKNVKYLVYYKKLVKKYEIDKENAFYQIFLNLINLLCNELYLKTLYFEYNTLMDLFGVYKKKTTFLDEKQKQRLKQIHDRFKKSCNVIAKEIEEIKPISIEQLILCDQRPDSEKLKKK